MAGQPNWQARFLSVFWNTSVCEVTSDNLCHVICLESTGTQKCVWACVFVFPKLSNKRFLLLVGNHTTSAASLPFFCCSCQGSSSFLAALHCQRVSKLVRQSVQASCLCSATQPPHYLTGPEKLHCAEIVSAITLGQTCQIKELPTLTLQKTQPLNTILLVQS